MNKKTMATLTHYKTKVLVVDDHPIVHEGLKNLLNREDDLEVCGFAQSVNDALLEIERISPHFVIANINLKGAMNGIDLISMINRDYPSIMILVLSTCDENLYAERVIRAGAKGYVMKGEHNSTIVTAIRDIQQSKIYLSPKMISKLLKNLLYAQPREVEPGIGKLTNRELEVFRLIGHGFRTNEIAKRLCISSKTIGTHRYRIRNKLNLNDSGDLVKYAIASAQSL